ncbi:MAG: BatD family protein [Fidelibacterota bacterium]
MVSGKLTELNLSKSLLFAGIVLWGMLLQGQTVTASIDANTVTINDVISFTIKAHEANSTPRADISAILQDFSIVSGPSTQTSMQFVNGKMSSTRSLSWTLVAKRTGKITIPALPVKVGKKTYNTNPLTITVTKNSVKNPAGEVFIKADIDKASVVVGEQVTVTYKLYTKVNMSIQQVEFPEFTGFWTEELYAPRQVDFRDTQIGGVRYKVATLYKVGLFPTQIGAIKLKPMVIDAAIVKKRKSSRRRSIWDDPFFNSMDPFFGNQQTVEKIIRTGEDEIEVRPFPTPPPPGFTNAIGQFSIRSSLDTAQISVNEAVTFRVILSGTGNLPILTLPEIDFPADIEVFPPTTDVKREPFRDEVSGTITTEYILIPREPGTYLLPGIVFHYFDPVRQTWEKTKTRGVRLSVRPGKEMAVSGTGFTKEEIVLLGKDIRYIRTSSPHWKLIEDRGLSWAILGWYLLAGAAFSLPGFVRELNQGRLSTQSDRQSKKAAKVALKALKMKEDDIFQQAERTIYTYLKARFGLRSEYLDPLLIEKEFATHIPADVLERLVQHLRVCDAGRFAPGAATHAESLLSDTAQIIKEIDAVS